MNIYAFIAFISGILSLSAGIYVRFKGKDSGWSRSYLFSSIAIFCYCFLFYGLSQFKDDWEFLIVWIKIFSLGAFLVVPLFFRFILLIVKVKKGLFKALYYVSLLVGLCSYVFLWGDKMPITFKDYFWGKSISFQNLFYFFFELNATLFLPIGVLSAFFRKKDEEDSKIAQRVTYVAITAICVAELAIILNFLPAYGLNLYHIGPPLLSLAFIYIAYTIIGYRFLELDLLVNKTVLAIFFITPMFILHIIVSNLFLESLGYWCATTFSFIIIIGILMVTPYRKLIENVVERAVYRGNYDYQKILQELSQTLVSMLDLEQLLSYIVQIIIQTIDIDKLVIFLHNEEEQNFSAAASYGMDKYQESNLMLEKDDALVLYLKENSRILVREELRQFKDKKEIDELFEPLKDIKVELIAPLFFKERLVGVIALSEKKSGHIYNQGDIDVLNAFAAEAAVAVENARLYDQAIIDGLTKLYHHNYFLMRLDEEITRSKRYGYPMALLMMDIDHFKIFNDTYGHQAGDMFLKLIGKVLKVRVRSVDISGRYGGEEFAVILPDIVRGSDSAPAEIIKSHIQEAVFVAERIRSAIESLKIEYEGKVLNRTISIGIAYFDGVDESFTGEELVRRADIALYKAKEMGRNKVVFYSKEYEQR